MFERIVVQTGGVELFQENIHGIFQFLDLFAKIEFGMNTFIVQTAHIFAHDGRYAPAPEPQRGIEVFG